MKVSFEDSFYNTKNKKILKLKKKGKSTELFLPTLKSNIKTDPVFYNVTYFTESAFYFRTQILLQIRLLFIMI